MESDCGEVTQLLRRWRAGDAEVEARLLELLMPDLHKIAERCFRREPAGNTLQPTALVNEAFIRLSKSKAIDWQDRGHFLAISARVMRRFLIERARVRPDIIFLPMDGVPEGVLGTRTPCELVIAVDELLNELEKASPIQRSVVEVKFFLGLTDQEGAVALDPPCILSSGSGPGLAAGYSTDSQGNHDKQPRT
jgi:RNA polymerase sigma factor (TIGR02999 family)